jgi:hypothetical protein
VYYKGEHMEPIFSLAVTAGITALITGLIAHVFWLKRADKQNLEALLTRVTILEQKALSEPRVREIISEETKELKAEIHSLKTNILSLSDLISNLRVDLGVLNYIKDKGEKKNGEA